RRPDARGGRARPGGRDLLALGNDLARRGGHADLGLQLVDDGGGRRPLGRGDPARSVVSSRANDSRRLIMLANSPVVAVVAVSDMEGARAFYSETLGLRPAEAEEPGGILYECAPGSQLLVYESGFAGGNRATAAS